MDLVPLVVNFVGKEILHDGKGEIRKTDPKKDDDMLDKTKLFVEDKEVNPNQK